MLVILCLITLFCLLLPAYFLLFTGRFFSRENTVIDAPIEAIAEDLGDLNNWQNWLPWLIYEPSAEVTYEYLNSGMHSVFPSCLVWRGKHIKEGYMSLEPTRSSAHYFHTLLEAPAFFPNDVHFNIDLTKQKERTLITLQITGKLPFLRRWKQKDYQLRAAKDTELALLKLLAYLAKHNTNPSHEYHQPDFAWLGQTRLNNIDAVTRPFVVSNQPMSQKMDQGFHDLMVELGSDNPPAGPSFALYKKVDIAHHFFSGRLGIPVQNMVPCELCPERIVLRGDYLHLRYTGRYQSLSLAWHVLYNFMRLHNLTPHPRRHGVEVFEVGPADTSHSKDYVTSVYLPIK
ncbi:AraC family transcriptional regulator [Marinomonas sp. M1K-6]|uniref:AraC family transcriptional regulator n=1 Tax=Marinomonas profundi TaxID=2726122 RepID=A0A847RBZ5_9GAMM|nr:AraC family transcriptional regulator [Marinomonas profundi]NLQ17730.1 AraC family transcriptional regulator [Marinomonas profundi]UDV04287.1 AraC family transcriptional regulator [Marinomonas profundi]